MRTKPLRIGIALLLILPLAAALMGARQARLVDPYPIEVPPGMEPAVVSRVIQTVIIKRHWTVTENENGRMIAVLMVRGHTARITIEYDEKSVQIRYLSSEKLDYEIKDDGQAWIHGNYLRWIQNIYVDLFRELNLPILEG